MTDPPTHHVMETRCSVAVFQHGCVLLIRSEEDGLPVWKLPGGHVRPDEGLIACARRELREETGLKAARLHCALVFDVHDRQRQRYVVEIVLFPTGGVQGELLAPEAGHEPRFVPMEQLDTLTLRPGIQSHLRGLKSLHEGEFSDGDHVPGAALRSLT
ncbi:NUDIX hydrolase [Streptomyces sp. TS71-3]|uniref:NUDIX hydrolase n=1 Tax=Streptomyces sp. TS71-3 TaxID=2733862 RepID=UPI001B26BD9B|nr:NUDIX hydrolase [Streptomyces sp. TS71-3]GHJ41181.1 hypothetical protein Sm713_67900 [Streptomyces sp. TS71-3]